VKSIGVVIAPLICVWRFTRLVCQAVEFVTCSFFILPAAEAVLLDVQNILNYNGVGVVEPWGQAVGSEKGQATVWEVKAVGQAYAATALL